MFSWYQRSLTRRPVLTQSLTTACLFALGDSIAQQGVEKKGLYNHDVIRTGRMTFYGGAILGPIAANWFRFLQNKVRLPSKRVTLLVRVAADQLLCAPIVTGIFLTSMSVMEGTNPKEKLERVYWKALRANWSIWPAFQAVNLSMVPAQYQVLAVNVFNIAWNCFLSLLNSTF